MAEKTEAPTPRRLSEARKEGMVARSQELNAAAALLIGAWLITGPGKKLFTDLQLLIINAVTNLPSANISTTWFTDQFKKDLSQVSNGVGIIIFGMLLTGVTISLSQTGFLWAQKKIGFDLNRLNPLNGFKRFLSPQGLVEWFKALIKLAVISWVAYTFLRGQITHILGLGQVDFIAAMGEWAKIATALAMRIGGSYMVLALADYAYQRWQYKHSLMMTKEEVKEDMKRSEGDPLLKSRIRGQQRRIARLRMMANVHKADVVITNPTHLAVAIQYDPQSMSAPKVLAKGAYLLAERIIELAKSNHIPVIQNIPLARALYRVVNIDQEIPSELYLAIAEVLAHVYALRGTAYSKVTS